VLHSRQGHIQGSNIVVCSTFWFFLNVNSDMLTESFSVPFHTPLAINFWRPTGTPVKHNNAGGPPCVDHSRQLYTLPVRAKTAALKSAAVPVVLTSMSNFFFPHFKVAGTDAMIPVTANTVVHTAFSMRPTSMLQRVGAMLQHPGAHDDVPRATTLTSVEHSHQHQLGRRFDKYMHLE